MKELKELEKRMYFFTIYQLTGIQIGIQCGHSALEYVQHFGKTDEYIDFITNWKTWIILNGGTTNGQRDFEGISQGTLNQIGDQLQENDIPFSFFHEPDLNDALTALCFICDERVFNREDYPDFIDYLVSIYRGEYSSQQIVELRLTAIETLKENEHYKEWIRSIGGVKNEFLRDLIKDKKLA